MKPFNLQEAIAGKPIQTRDGRVLKFVAHVPEASVGSKVVIMNFQGYIGAYPENGKSSLDEEEWDNDIVMAPVIKTYYVNIFKGNYSNIVVSSSPLEDEEEVQWNKDKYLQMNNVKFITTLTFDIEE
jgi:hypothetical protein